ncbi:hypothetical protein PGB90_004132 [Kerria lacca]
MAVEGPSKTDIQLVFKRLRAIPTNKNMFFRQHNCTTTDVQQKYNSRAAQLYKDKLLETANQALKTYGTQLIVDHLTQDNTEDSLEKEEPDFFEEHSNMNNFNNKNEQSPILLPKKVISDEEVLSSAPTLVPNVENAFSANDAGSEKAHIIGIRNSTSKRSSLGGKKSSLGAQRVKANFADIERDAVLADQIKFSIKEEQTKPDESVEDQVNSVRLAYQDLSIKQKREEDKLKQIDPKKAEQVERLGMGFNTKSGVSHSALNDMQMLDADVPKKKDFFVLDRTEDDDFFDCFTSIPSDLKDLGIFLAESTATKKKINWKEDHYDQDSSNTDVSKDYGSKVVWEEPKTYGISKSETTSQRNTKTNSSIATSSGEAQKKFGSAKSISSAQYFGDTYNSGEERMNLCQFEGSTSISSAELFGKPNVENIGMQAPDFDDVKESVRLGVTKVAGKLSSLASGVMSSIQM